MTDQFVPRNVRFNDLPYMNGPEKISFEIMVKSGAQSIFGLAHCGAEGCEEYVPKDAKMFCSLGCYQKEQDDGGEAEEEETPWGMD